MQILARYGLELLLMACLLVCSSFFSASEAALFSLTREQLRRFDAAGGLLAGAIGSLLRSRTDLLVSLLLGNTCVNVFFFATSFKIVAAATHEASVISGGLFGVGSFLVLLLVGEVAPKGVAVRRPVAVASTVALPMRAFHWVATPFRWLLTPLGRRIARLLPQRSDDGSYVSAEELKMLVELSHQQGLLDADTRQMLNRVVGLGDRLVKEVMIPRVDVVFFELARPNEEFIALVRRTHHKRFPACEGSVDNVVGLIHASDVFMNPGRPARDFVRPVPFVPETKTVEDLLHEFRDMRRHTAIVVDEHGGTAGMITLEDILEEVVGEIRDEFEPREPVVRVVGPDTYVVPGYLSTRAWRDVFGISLTSPDFETVGGFVVSLLGRLPKEGDSVSYAGLVFTVESVRGHRIRRLRVHAPNAQAELSSLLDD